MSNIFQQAYNQQQTENSSVHPAPEAAHGGYSTTHAQLREVFAEVKKLEDLVTTAATAQQRSASGTLFQSPGADEKRQKTEENVRLLRGLGAQGQAAICLAEMNGATQSTESASVTSSEQPSSVSLGR